MESPTLKRLLKNLRELRKVHGLTQEEFSEISGIAYKYYQAVEAGRKLQPRLSTLERLAKPYGLQVHELLSPTLPSSKLIRKPRSKQAKTSSYLSLK